MMSSRFNTVRMKYIYICGASAVLSTVLLFVVYQIMSLAYRLMFHEVVWVTAMVHWCINHIGKKPFLLAAGGGLFVLFFWIRSQKIAEDLQQLVRGAHELASGQTPSPICVLSSGELRQLSDQINAIAARTDREERAVHLSRLQKHDVEDITDAPPHSRSERIDLPIELTLYGVQSALEELLKGPGRHDAEVRHWARAAYEQTALLQHALGVSERKADKVTSSIKGKSEEVQC